MFFLSLNLTCCFTISNSDSSFAIKKHDTVWRSTVINWCDNPISIVLCIWLSVLAVTIRKKDDLQCVFNQIRSRMKGKWLKIEECTYQSSLPNSSNSHIFSDGLRLRFHQTTSDIHLITLSFLNLNEYLSRWAFMKKRWSWNEQLLNKQYRTT